MCLPRTPKRAAVDGTGVGRFPDDGKTARARYVGTDRDKIQESDGVGGEQAKKLPRSWGGQVPHFETNPDLP